MDNYFDRPDYLRSLPGIRAAYSDRTSWLLAEMCRLAYEKLPIEETEVTLVEAIMKASESDAPKDALSKLVKDIIASQQKGTNRVANTLENIGFTLIGGFSHEGTEGFLTSFKSADNKKSFRVLAFRGTETTSFTDIKNDLRTNLVSAPKGGRVHAGFLNAYQKAEEPLKAMLKKEDHLPLYITGHSLGGALAMVATKYLDSDEVHATYTYGCPRVGDDKFYSNIKTPIYRVINAGDCVPRVPFGFLMSILLTGLRLVPFNGTRVVSEWLRRNLCGYTHWGNLVFLSPLDHSSRANKNPINFQVRFSPDIFWRSTIVVRRWINTFGKSLIQDHNIRDYSQKLGDYAEWRNQKD